MALNAPVSSCNNCWLCAAPCVSCRLVEQLVGSVGSVAVKGARPWPDVRPPNPHARVHGAITRASISKLARPRTLTWRAFAGWLRSYRSSVGLQVPPRHTRRSRSWRCGGNVLSSLPSGRSLVSSKRRRCACQRISGAILLRTLPLSCPTRHPCSGTSSASAALARFRQSAAKRTVASGE